MSQKFFPMLKSNKILASLVALGLTLGGLGTSAMAVIIAPGQTLPTTGTATYGGLNVLSYGPVAFTGTDFSNNVAFTGFLTANVYSDPANPFGAGDLDFVYQFSDDANPNNDPILHFSMASFSGYLTAADYVAGSGTGTNLPTTVERDSANSGDTIDFNFPLASSVAEGTTSVQLVVVTNATSIAPGLASLQDGGNTSLEAPAPASVPEPATVSIAAFTVFGLGIRRRKAAGN